MDTIKADWAELAGQVRRFVGRRIDDPHAADDVAQDVMLKVQAHPGDLPPEERLPAWVLTVARNAVIDYYRARGARDERALDGAEIAADAPEPREALRDLVPCLANMVRRLPQPYREALTLADLQGLSRQEVADQAGVSLSGAKSRVQRARQQLRDMIHDCCDVTSDGRGGVADVETTERTRLYCDVKDAGKACRDDR